MQRHRLWNDSLCFLDDVHCKIKDLQGEDCHREKLKKGEPRDKVTQVPLTSRLSEKVKQTAFHGAWGHASPYSIMCECGPAFRCA